MFSMGYGCQWEFLRAREKRKSFLRRSREQLKIVSQVSCAPKLISFRRRLTELHVHCLLIRVLF